MPSETKTRDFHQYLLACVAPRPIALASTIDDQGKSNLAPYSFFNAFSSNPPIVVFSSNRRVRDNSTKDTLHNVKINGEVVINMVNYRIVRQMAITSVEFETGISEFEKAGLTPLDSETISPFRVKEAPAQLECKVRDIITLGHHGGAGHLIICEVSLMHINESVIDDNNRVDPHKMDLMGRMGRSYYVRASGDAIHTIVQAVSEKVIGVDQLPESVRKSKTLTGNDIAMLGGVTDLPDKETVKECFLKVQPELIALSDNEKFQFLHSKAKQLLESNDRETALIYALTGELI